MADTSAAARALPETPPPPKAAPPAQKTLTPAQVKEVRRMMEAYSCFACHSLGGVGGLPTEPALDQVGNHRDLAWIKSWLRDPKSVKPNTIMPKFPLEKRALDLLALYLSSLRKDIPSEQIFADAATPAAAGQKLYGAYDCQACHKIGKTGRAVGPELTKVGLMRTPAKIEKWIRSPQAAKPGTFMPAYALADSEVTALVAYLSTLK